MYSLLCTIRELSNLPMSDLIDKKLYAAYRELENEREVGKYPIPFLDFDFDKYDGVSDRPYCVYVYESVTAHAINLTDLTKSRFGFLLECYLGSVINSIRDWMLGRSTIEAVYKRFRDYIMTYPGYEQGVMILNRVRCLSYDMRCTCDISRFLTGVLLHLYSLMQIVLLDLKAFSFEWCDDSSTIMTEISQLIKGGIFGDVD